MVDEFMVCVDRMIVTSASCFNDSSNSNPSSQTPPPPLVNNSTAKDRQETALLVALENGGGEGCSKPKGTIRECRICQEEDDDKDMEAPCACNGTLKFAHRKCIQRWCNKKGDITCEICNQVFSPNYTTPPPKSNGDVLAIDISQAWGPHIDLRDPRFLAFAAAERQFLQSEYDDYALANSGTLNCFRSVAIILMLILLVRQTLLLTRDFGLLQESPFFTYQISVLQLAGFLLPCYVVARSWYIAQLRRRRQG